MNLPLYLLDTALISPLGPDAPSTLAAVASGISAYAVTDYTAPNGSPLVMSLIPDDALPTLNYAFHDTPFISIRLAVMLRSFHAAFLQLEPQLREYGPLPLFLSVPMDLGQGYEKRWLHILTKQYPSIMALISNCQLFSSGRSGSLEALQAAREWLDKNTSQVALVAGVDSFQDPTLLNSLAGRLKSENGNDGFVPGEGCCLLLISNHSHQEKGMPCVRLGEIGIASEPGYFTSKQPYRGDGLSRAVANSLQSVPQCQHWYTSANGENYWAKEIGITHIRNAAKLVSTCEHSHPAEFLGDTGAAAGCYLIALAAYQLRESNNRRNVLVTCSSDGTVRTAVTVSCGLA